MIKKKERYGGPYGSAYSALWERGLRYGPRHHIAYRATAQMSNS
jgi:hypothetical protein